MEPINTGRRVSKFAAAAKNALAENNAEKIESASEISSMRPIMREEDSRAAAAKRAAQLREHLGDRKSTRLNSSHIPLSRMPSSA